MSQEYYYEETTSAKINLEPIVLAKDREQKDIMQNIASKIKTFLLAQTRLGGKEKKQMRQKITHYFKKNGFSNSQLAVVAAFIFLKNQNMPKIGFSTRLTKLIEQIDNKFKTSSSYDKISLKLNILQKLTKLMCQNQFDQIGTDAIFTLAHPLFQNTQAKKTFDTMKIKLTKLLQEVPANMPETFQNGYNEGEMFESMMDWQNLIFIEDSNSQNFLKSNDFEKTQFINPKQ